MRVSCILKFALATLSKEHPQSLRGTHVYLTTENHFAVFHWHPVVRQRGVCGKQEKRSSSQITPGDISEEGIYLTEQTVVCLTG